MTLGQLIDVIDLHRDYDDNIIQICGEDFDDVELTAPTSSKFLVPFYGYSVISMSAIQKDVIRVELKEPDTIVTISEHGWIPVTDRLPEKDGLYIVTMHGDCWGEPDEIATSSCDFCDGKFGEFGVIAWMEFPKKYEG